ncbi:MAG: UDP-N-acetylmuramoyl-tripeptide--D-alanyl-D-alanine ligase [Prevotellaceae bacterium]|nr:UDP-N-acetylmuramoyl-tripeptide--D-alanyl-D-alanine ligase [Prevotellaceae bacterium]
MDIKELYAIYKEHPVVTTDSRDVPQGSIFFALKGESFDGNKYAVQALEKGASYAVIDDAEVFNSAEMDETIGEKSLILVDNVLQTFKDLAREHRRQFDIPVIGITGTNGKTTTKELLSAVLSEKYNVMFTQGNFNNDVGVPKTLFRLTPEHEIAVVEMGASHPGDIKTLVETAEPTCGLITNVGRAHLQGFGSFEGVKKTKGELYDSLAPNPSPTRRGEWNDSPFVFLNTKDADLCEMAEQRGVKTEAYVDGRVLKCDPYLSVELEDGTVIHTKLIGSYNVVNVLAALTVGRHFGVSDEQIVHALENYKPSNNRSQLTVTEKNRLVVDAYNANPTSMAAAIDNFRLIETDLKKMAILGDMKELGEVSEKEHQTIVAKLDEAAFDEVWLVGEMFEKTAPGYRCFANVDEVKAAIAATPIANRFILIKGSNSTKLFQLPELL